MTDTIDRAAFALAIEAKRVHRRLTVSEAARQAGITPQTFGLATGGCPLRPANFEKLCKWAGENPATFTKGDGDG